MTASSVLLDTWSWFEIFGDSVRGRRLRAKYLANPGVRVHSSIITLAEISAKLALAGRTDRIPGALAHVETRSRVEGITREIAERAGPLRVELRKADPDAGLVDAVLLATARALGCTLVSGDPAFDGVPDAIDH